MKTLTRNWRDHWRIGTQKLYRDISTGTAVFINWKRVNVCEHTTKMASHLCRVHKHSLFWLMNTAVPVEISRYSFCVPILQWSLQFLVGVFTFLSLILWYSYLGTFLSTWSLINKFDFYVNKRKNTWERK